MDATRERARSAVTWIERGLPWVVLLAISGGIALAINTAAARALPELPASDVASNDAHEVINLCALRVDGPLYAFVAAPEARNFYDRVCTSSS